MTHTLPFDLVADPRECRLMTPALLQRIESAINGYFFARDFQIIDPLGLGGEVLTGFYMLTNISGLAESEYGKFLFPQFSEALVKLGISEDVTDGIGTPDSFFSVDPSTATRVLENFLTTNSDGIYISLYPDERPDVGFFTCETHLSAGASRQTLCPCEPVSKVMRHSEVLSEFQENLGRDLTEAKWEAFLTRYFQEIFGPTYDRVETQIWLRLPEIESAAKAKRLDVFLRNSVIGDWELVELKRPANIIKSYRDIHTFTAEVQNAVQQVRYYDRLLRSDDVRRRLAAEGIEYYEPELKVVIGRRPAIPLRDWRWLLESCRGNVKIITYDDLISEMKARLSL